MFHVERFRRFQLDLPDRPPILRRGWSV